MNKPRKLAWVVLGVVAVGLVVFLVRLSTLYSPWTPVVYGPHDSLPRRHSPALRRAVPDLNRYYSNIYYGKTRQQRFRRMPGEDVVSILITREEWLELKLTETVDVVAVPGHESEFEGHPIRSLSTLRRWSPQTRHGKTVVYYLETGMKCYQCQYEDGRCLRYTMWDFDGKVRHQRWYVDEDGEVLVGQEEGRKFTPPWLWGVTDQTATSMPEWMKDDAKWQAARDEQK